MTRAATRLAIEFLGHVAATMAVIGAIAILLAAVLLVGAGYWLAAAFVALLVGPMWFMFWDKLVSWAIRNGR